MQINKINRFDLINKNDSINISILFCVLKGYIIGKYIISLKIMQITKWFTKQSKNHTKLTNNISK